MLSQNRSRHARTRHHRRGPASPSSYSGRQPRRRNGPHDARLDLLLDARPAPGPESPRFRLPADGPDAMSSRRCMGCCVEDPYRWLEDDNAPETKAWVEAQNQVTFAYLEAHPAARRDQAAPDRSCGTTSATACPSRTGRALLLHHERRPAEPERALHARRRSRPSRASCSIRTRSRADGTVALAGFAVSDDGNCWPTASPAPGSDWQEWQRPRRAHRPGHRPTSSSGSSSPAPPGPRTARASSTAATTSPTAEREADQGELLPEALLPPRSARRSPRTRSSTSGPTRRNGASAATSPTTAAT